tara:strand:+ start:2342 stop:4876 length:2535 start_codon:yes stop_codon:yes gene_type:complete
MAGGMNFVRFMKGALKGEIAHQEAVAKAEADRIKAEQEAEKEEKAFIRDLIKGLPFERLGPDTAKLIGDVKSVSDVLNIYANLEEEPDNEGFKYLTEKIFTFGKDNPSLIKNLNFDELSVVTNMETAKEYLAMNPSMFDALGSGTGKSQVEKDFFDINKGILNTINKAIAEGKKFTGTPLDYDAIDMYSADGSKILQTFLNTVAPTDDKTKPEELSPDNFTFKIGDQNKIFSFKGTTKPADIVSNMITMTNMLKEQGDLSDPIVQDQFITEMRRQRARAEELFRTALSEGGSSVPNNMILDIGSFTTMFKDDPDFAFAAGLFEAFEKGQRYEVAADIKSDGDGLEEKQIIESPPAKGKFSELASVLGFADEKEMFSKFANLRVNNQGTKLFEHADKIRTLIPGLFIDNKNILSSFGTLELNQENREKLFTTLNLLSTDKNSNVEQQIAVLSILSNVDSPTLKLGEGSYSIPKEFEKYLISIASGIAEEGKDVKTIEDAQALINRKVTDGEDIIELVNSQLDYLNKGKVNTGAARDLIMGIKGFFGTGGQVSQIKDFIMGGFGGKYAFRVEDFDSQEDYEKAVDAAVYAIQTSDNAIVATQEVFLAYQIAKYNDEGGRLSNQDYSYNLQAVTGGKFANRIQARSHLLTVKKRFEKEYTKFKMFRFSTTKLQRSNKDAREYAEVLMRRLDATKQYYDMYESGQIKRAELIRNYPVNAKIKAKRNTAVLTESTVQNESSEYFGQKIFQLVDTRTNNPVFEDEGGIYAVRVGSKFFTLPFKDVPLNVLDPEGDVSTALSAESNYEELSQEAKEATGFSHKVTQGDGQVNFITEEQYNNLNLNNESTPQ